MQADLFFYMKGEDLEYKIGLLLVDAFSKYCVVIPLKSKLVPDVLQGFKKPLKRWERNINQYILILKEPVYLMNLRNILKTIRLI